MNVPIMLAPKDAGRILGLTTSAVTALAVRGKLKALRDSGGRRFYDLREIERLRCERAEGTRPRQVPRRTRRAPNEMP